MQCLKHYGDNGHVEGEQDGSRPARMMQEPEDLERNVDCAAGSRQHFGPGALVEQAVGFDEARCRIECGPGGQQAEASVLQAAGGIEKDLRILGSADCRRLQLYNP